MYYDRADQSFHGKGPPAVREIISCMKPVCGAKKKVGDRCCIWCEWTQLKVLTQLITAYSDIFRGRSLLQVEGPRGREARLCHQEKQRSPERWARAVGGISEEGNTVEKLQAHESKEALRWLKKTALSLQRHVWWKKCFSLKLKHYSALSDRYIRRLTSLSLYVNIRLHPHLISLAQVKSDSPAL